MSAEDRGAMCTARGRQAGAPRSVRGGHSARYEARRTQRGSVRAWAPGWSDATAAAVMDVLEDCAENATGSKTLKKQKIAGLLASADGVRLLVAAAGKALVPSDRKDVEAILQKHHLAVASCMADGDLVKAAKLAHSFLKPLYARRHGRLYATM